MTRRARRRIIDFFSSIRRAAELNLQDASTTADREPEPVDEIAAARDAGDFFSVGALLATKLHSADVQAAGPLLARIVAAWAAPKGPLVKPESPIDLLARLGSLSQENAAVALINAVRRLPPKAKGDLPAGVNDLAYRLRDAIAQIYGVVDRRSPTDVCTAAAANIEAALYDFKSSAQRFLRTSPETAKGASVELLKKLHPLQPMLVPAEREFLHDLEVIIGPAFRRLCEAYERNDDAEVLRRAPEFLANVKSHTPVTSDPRFRSGAWNSTVAPILGHVSSLVAEAMSRGEVALAPLLKFRNGTTKADLRHPEIVPSIFRSHCATLVADTRTTYRCEAVPQNLPRH